MTVAMIISFFGIKLTRHMKGAPPEGNIQGKAAFNFKTPSNMSYSYDFDYSPDISQTLNPYAIGLLKLTLIEKDSK